MAHQLSYLQRQSIKRLLDEGKSYAHMARVIGVHRSTVKRELDRNTFEGEYHPRKAHSMALSRKRMTAYWAKPPVTHYKIIHPVKKRYQKMLPGYRSVLLRVSLFYRLRFHESKQDRTFRLRYTSLDRIRYYHRSLIYREWKRYYEQTHRIRFKRDEFPFTSFTPTESLNRPVIHFPTKAEHTREKANRRQAPYLKGIRHYAPPRNPVKKPNTIKKALGYNTLQHGKQSQQWATSPRPDRFKKSLGNSISMPLHKPISNPKGEGVSASKRKARFFKISIPI